MIYNDKLIIFATRESTINIDYSIKYAFRLIITPITCEELLTPFCIYLDFYDQQMNLSQRFVKLTLSIKYTHKICTVIRIWPTYTGRLSGCMLKRSVYRYRWFQRLYCRCHCRHIQALIYHKSIILTDKAIKYNFHHGVSRGFARFQTVHCIDLKLLKKKIPT